ncbi:MAG TPA: hypothetical protein VFC78_01570 [Tepidisphaeraceae bacterium]|nr:hypothetical protein [Tepidisphaeraceae bacterium]
MAKQSLAAAPGAITRLPARDELFTALHRIAVVTKAPLDVKRYVDTYAALGDAVLEACRAARVQFPLPTELALQVYRDSDSNDTQLVLFVRADEYTREFLDRVEALATTQNLTPDLHQGRVDILTDFRLPGGD